MAHHQHSLQDLVEELSGRISALEQKRDELLQQVQGGRNSAKNQDALKRMTESITHAQGAKKMMMDSCCTSQSCNFDDDI